MLGAAIKLSKCRLRGAKAFLFNWNNKFYMELSSFIEGRLFRIENLSSIFNDRLGHKSYKALTEFIYGIKIPGKRSPVIKLPFTITAFHRERAMLMS